MSVSSVLSLIGFTCGRKDPVSADLYDIYYTLQLCCAQGLYNNVIMALSLMVSGRADVPLFSPIPPSLVSRVEKIEVYSGDDVREAVLLDGVHAATTNVVRVYSEGESQFDIEITKYRLDAILVYIAYRDLEDDLNERAYWVLRLRSDVHFPFTLIEASNNVIRMLKAAAASLVSRGEQAKLRVARALGMSEEEARPHLDDIDVVQSALRKSIEGGSDVDSAISEINSRVSELGLEVRRKPREPTRRRWERET